MMIPCDLLILQNFGNFNETAQMNALAVRDDNLFLQNAGIANVIGVVGHILRVELRREWECFFFIDRWINDNGTNHGGCMIEYTPEVIRARMGGKHWCLYPSHNMDPWHSGSNCHTGDCTWPNRFAWCDCRWQHTAIFLTDWFPLLGSVLRVPPRKYPII